MRPPAPVTESLSAPSARRRSARETRSNTWEECWRRSSRRWERFAPSLSAATGWRIWNPGRYGEPWHSLFRSTYPLLPRPILIFGLNPGPYGMAQTGIPFTDIKRLRQKLPDLAARIRRRYGECEIPGLAPSSLRPFLTRSFESSSVRFYRFLDLGWECAEEGWKHVAVANACPLLFVEPASRSNRTPADLRRAASRGIRNDLRARELCQACTRLRCLAAHEAEQALDPRGVILLGKDVQRALAESFEGKLGKNAVVHWEHPARAVPERWARGLLEELRGRAWK